MQIGSRVVHARVRFEPRDVWVGLYWNRPTDWCTDIYICVAPCIPLHIRIGEAIPFVTPEAPDA